MNNHQIIVRIVDGNCFQPLSFIDLMLQNCFSVSYFLLLPTWNELKLYFAGSAKAEHGSSGLTLFSHYCKLEDTCETIDLHCYKILEVD